MSAEDVPAIVQELQGRPMAVRELLFDHADRDLTKLAEYREVGGYEPLKHSARDGAATP